MQLEFVQNAEETPRLERLILLGARGGEMEEVSICPLIPRCILQYIDHDWTLNQRTPWQ